MCLNDICLVVRREVNMGIVLTTLIAMGGAALAHALKKDKRVETEAKDSIAHSSNAFSKLEKQTTI